MERGVTCIICKGVGRVPVEACSCGLPAMVLSALGFYYCGELTCMARIEAKKDKAPEAEDDPQSMEDVMALTFGYFGRSRQRGAMTPIVDYSHVN